MDGTLLDAVDAGLEEFRRCLRVRVRRAVRESLGLGVGGAAFRIIETVLLRGPLSPSELAAVLEVRTSTMAAHLDRLEELGWARREPAGTNRVRVSITDAGRGALEHYVSLRRAVLAEVLRPLSPRQAAHFARLLRVCVAGQDGAATGGGFN